MSTPEGAVEENFRLGLVTTVIADRAQLLVLHSRRFLPENYDDNELDEYDRAISASNRAAIDTDIPPDFTHIELLKEDIVRDIKIPEPWTIGGLYKVLSPQVVGKKWGQLRPGSILHMHDFYHPPVYKQLENGVSFTVNSVREYCVQPIALSADGIRQAIEHAKVMRNLRLLGMIAAQEQKEQRLLVEHEVVDVTKPIRLFEGAQIKIGRRDQKYLEVPPRVIVSPRHGIQILNVRGSEYTVQKDKPDGAGVFRWTVDGNTYWIPYMYPFEETDDRGVPKDIERPRARISISLTNPYRFLAKGITEERASIRIGNSTYWTQPCEEFLAGDQGFGGIKLLDFLDVNNADPFYEIRTPGAPPLPQPLRSVEMLVPIDDLEALMELEIRLPGFE